MENKNGSGRKFLIQNSQTGEFIRCDSKWSSVFHEAFDFFSADRAAAFGVKQLKVAFGVVQMESNAVESPPAFRPDVIKGCKVFPEIRPALESASKFASSLPISHPGEILKWGEHRVASEKFSNLILSHV
jgi:hypothetical protein